MRLKCCAWACSERQQYNSALLTIRYNNHLWSYKYSRNCTITQQQICSIQNSYCRVYNYVLENWSSSEKIHHTYGIGILSLEYIIQYFFLIRANYSIYTIYCSKSAVSALVIIYNIYYNIIYDIPTYVYIDTHTYIYTIYNILFVHTYITDLIKIDVYLILYYIDGYNVLYNDIVSVRADALGARLTLVARVYFLA